MSLAERVLLAFSRDPESPEYEGGTARATVDNALDFLVKTVPGFRSLIKDKDVLDFGCGYGLQAVAMARSGARTVTGVDLPRPALLERWRAIQQLNCDNVKLVTEPPTEKFDVVVSCSSFEHFSDPAAILFEMQRHTRPGGLVIISFAEPWLSPRGAHCDQFTRLPWVNCFFPEKAVLAARSRFRQDGATRYEEIEGGLNRMTVSKFEKFMRNSGMKVRSIHLFPVKGLPLVSKIPMVREFFTAAASCILEA
jgi:SAM-dependent methyltransferase